MPLQALGHLLLAEPKRAIHLSRKPAETTGLFGAMEVVGQRGPPRLTVRSIMRDRATLGGDCSLEASESALERIVLGDRMPGRQVIHQPLAQRLLTREEVTPRDGRGIKPKPRHPLRQDALLKQSN